MLRSITLKFEKWFSWMCLTSCNTFQKHLLSQKENLIFWPQKWIFEISEAIFDSFWHPNMRKRHCKATLKVSKKFWDLQSKIVSIRLFQMFWGLIWYHSRGHTTKIDFGKRSRLKKKQKLPRDEPFEIIGFMCWLNIHSTWYTKIPFLVTIGLQKLMGVKISS